MDYTNKQSLFRPASQSVDSESAQSIDDLEDGDKDNVKRKTRNLSEKKRRDQFNILINELCAMVAANTKKLDKSTILKSAIQFLRNHQEFSVQSAANEIKEDWKPLFLCNEEFAQLMLEAVESFLVVFTQQGRVLFVSDSVASLLGHLPSEVINHSIYDYMHEDDRIRLFNLLSTFQSQHSHSDDCLSFTCHLRRGSIDPTDPVTYEYVKFFGLSQFMEVEDEDMTYENNSGFMDLPKQSVCFSCTIHLQTAHIIREMNVIDDTGSEFTSRHSLEFKFLFLDHRAPPIIGYLPFEVLGTSGYDYYHPDDLEVVSKCHEQLMLMGKGRSTCYRFLTKGQQWIWLQTRYFVTYHQWNSKPEFIVCTNTVVRYNVVRQQLRQEMGYIEGDDTTSTIVNSTTITSSGSITECHADVARESLPQREGNVTSIDQSENVIRVQGKIVQSPHVASSQYTDSDRQHTDRNRQYTDNDGQHTDRHRIDTDRQHTESDIHHADSDRQHTDRNRQHLDSNRQHADSDRQQTDNRSQHPHSTKLENTNRRHVSSQLQSLLQLHLQRSLSSSSTSQTNMAASTKPVLACPGISFSQASTSLHSSLTSTNHQVVVSQTNVIPSLMSAMSTCLAPVSTSQRYLSSPVQPNLMCQPQFTIVTSSLTSPTVFANPQINFQCGLVLTPAQQMLHEQLMHKSEQLQNAIQRQQEELRFIKEQLAYAHGGSQMVSQQQQCQQQQSQIQQQQQYVLQQHVGLTSQPVLLTPTSSCTQLAMMGPDSSHIFLSPISEAGIDLQRQSVLQAGLDLQSLQQQRQSVLHCQQNHQQIVFQQDQGSTSRSMLLAPTSPCPQLSTGCISRPMVLTPASPCPQLSTGLTSRSMLLAPASPGPQLSSGPTSRCMLLAPTSPGPQLSMLRASPSPIFIPSSSNINLLSPQHQQQQDQSLHFLGVPESNSTNMD